MTLYTLEKHLEEWGKTNEEYKILFSNWIINKASIPQALSTIGFNFPHFSRHDESHSISIIRNIELFLGVSRIEMLSPTDTWLLLMTAYVHDLGMMISDSLIKNDWETDTFQDYLVSVNDYSFDKDLREAARYIIDVQERQQKCNKKTDKLDLLWPIKVRKHVTLLISSFYRPQHAELSEKMLKDNEFRDLSRGMFPHIIQQRLTNLFGIISACHGKNFNDVLKSLSYSTNGFSSDYAHPRFIAYMLRIGDLLDMENNRFNVFHEYIFGTLPESSQVHLEKHLSVEHLLIQPEKIEATIDVQTEGAYRVSRSWLDLLENEARNISQNWSDIVPKNVGGYPPSVKSENLKVFKDGQSQDGKLYSLKFKLSDKKAFELIEGIGVYDKPHLVFIRELLQNSLDAIKTQIWRDITSHRYFGILNKKHGSKYDEIESINYLDLIKFPNDIPAEIYENYQVNLKVWVDDNDKNSIRFKITDNGTGISEKELIRISKEVGKNKYNSNQGIFEFKSFPYFLKPTASFGFGLHSLFNVTNEINITTKVDGETGKEIVLRSGIGNGYISVNEDENILIRGTTIEIEIKKDKIPYFSFNVVDSYDYYIDDEITLHQNQILDYLINLSWGIKYYRIKIKAPDINFEKTIHNLNYSDFDKPKPTNSENKYQIELRYDGFEPVVQYRIYENILGSEIKIALTNDFKNYKFSSPSRNYFDFKLSYMVRDIPVTQEKFYHHDEISYIAILWNLLNPKSDKILKFNRDQLIPKTKSEHEKILREQILPMVFPQIYSLLTKEIQSDENDITKFNWEFCFFQIWLTESILKANDDSYIIQTKVTDLKEATLNTDKVSNKSFNKIKLKKFYEANSFLIVKITDPSKQKKATVYNQYVKTHFSNCNYDIIVWDDGFFESYFKKLFVVKSLLLEDSGNMRIEAYYIEKDILNYSNVQCANESTKKKILKKLVNTNTSQYKKDREYLYPIEPHAKILSVKNYDNNFKNPFSKYCNHFIISPFYNSRIVGFIKEGITLHGINSSGAKRIKAFIKENYISDVVNDKLIEMIQENSAMCAKPEKEAIIDSYIDLIYDYLTIE